MAAARPATSPRSPPDDKDVERLLRRVARRTLKLARARFPDGLPYAEDAWDLELHASAQGSGAGQPFD